MRVKNKNGFIEYEEEERKRKKKIPNTAKAVEQWDTEGHLLATYRSIGEASRKTGCGETGISNCAKGKQKMSGGYIWKFVSK